MVPMIFGTVGLVFLISGFTLVDSGRLKLKSASYNLLNILGALFLAVYAWDLQAYIFVLLELFWATIALFELLLIINKKR